MPVKQYEYPEEGIVSGRDILSHYVEEIDRLPMTNSTAGPSLFTKIIEPVFSNPDTLNMTLQAVYPKLERITSGAEIKLAIGSRFIREAESAPASMKAELLKTGDIFGKSIEERQNHLDNLETLVKTVREALTLQRNEGAAEVFNLTDEDRLRFILQGFTGSGTRAENIASILELGIRVDPKKNTDKIPVTQKNAGAQFGFYDPFSYAKGPRGAVVLWSEELDNDPKVAAWKEGIIGEIPENKVKVVNGEEFFKPDPVLVACLTDEGKELILKDLEKEGMLEKWGDKIKTLDELIGKTSERREKAER